VGRVGGRQQLNLQPYQLEVGCFRLYTIVHEFLHAIGIYHMQSATERDEYVRIVEENIQAGTLSNFRKYGSDVVSQFGVEYDYGSVMHYSKTAFSINGSDTIVAIRDMGGEIMGQRVRLSKKDIQRVNNMYCPKPQPPPVESIPDLFGRINQRVNTMMNHVFKIFKP
jgi:Astacin (Peptidase family M12A)